MVIGLLLGADWNAALCNLKILIQGLFWRECPFEQVRNFYVREGIIEYERRVYREGCTRSLRGKYEQQ